jgi:hypothetical protein
MAQKSSCLQGLEMPQWDEEPATEKSEKSESISREFKANPTIEHYVRLRRENPDVQIEPSIYGGIDHAYELESLLEGFGIDIRLYVSTLDADEAAICELSLQLLENMILAQALERQGGTHLASRQKVIPDHLIDWLVCCMLDSLSWNDSLDIPRDLIVLIRSRLIKGESTIEKLVEVRSKKFDAEMIAGQLIMPSFRLVAKLMGVQPSTVMRWFDSEQEFLDIAAKWRKFYEPGGLHEELVAIRKKSLREKQRAQRQPSDVSS